MQARRWCVHRLHLTGHLLGLADGLHTFTVKATDPAGNTAQASRAWTVDTTPPTVEITGGKPGDPTNSKSVTFTFTTTESTMECKLDSGAFATCTSPRATAS